MQSVLYVLSYPFSSSRCTDARLTNWLTVNLSLPTACLSMLISLPVCPHVSNGKCPYQSESVTNSSATVLLTTTLNTTQCPPSANFVPSPTTTAIAQYRTNPQGFTSWFNSSEHTQVKNVPSRVQLAVSIIKHNHDRRLWCSFKKQLLSRTKHTVED